MKITRAEAYLCDLAVERPRTDAIQAFTKQETDDGFQGTGYAYTIGTGGRAVLQLLRVDLVDGYAIAPSEPGIGIAWDREAIERPRMDG